MRRNCLGALFVSLLIQGFAWSGKGGGSAAAAADSLARHLAVESQSPSWAESTIDIEASLPKLAEHGHLQAIRRRLSYGPPEYQVVATDGDRTVRQQVIARYLSADLESAALPPGSVAITPANYRFQYRASISDGKTLTYVFEITPRQKRAGLIRGQLWIDAATGMTVRQTGYLVRTPSIFVKHIHVTRYTSLRGGSPYARTTRIEIDTRLMGRAELTIRERPYWQGM
jgi:hypothetical protein